MRIAFTGHRPTKLGGYDWSSNKNKLIMGRVKELLSHIMNKYDEDYEFITGGALGLDQMAFSICYDIKYSLNRAGKITQTLAIPYKDQPNKWFGDSVTTHESNILKADKVVYVDSITGYEVANCEIGRYDYSKLQNRNRYMVGNCDWVIAVWDGTPSGTANCVAYAKELGKRIIIIDANTLELSVIN